MQQCQFKISTLADTQLLAKTITSSIIPNFVVTLSGELGSGKSTLVRLVLQQMGVSGNVKSPTYTLVEAYPLNDMYIYHFDLYRFSIIDEWVESGFDEYFVHKSICFIEWAEKARELIPVVDWDLTIKVSDNIRNVTISAHNANAMLCLDKLYLGMTQAIE